MVKIGDYESAPDRAAASWVVDGLRGFADSVVSLVPSGFEAYARVFHPAWQWEARTRVRWRDVAHANGRIAHRAMQWPGITGSFRYYHGAHQPGIWDHEPLEGSLPEELAPVLVSVLAGHTMASDQCWFAVWDGYGCFQFSPQDAPAFDIPHRSLLLFTGPITAVLASMCGQPWWQSPSLWWPQDRAWCVETEVDMMSTYVGGTRQCVEELVDRDDLEAAIVDPADGVTWASDELNPQPT